MTVSGNAVSLTRVCFILLLLVGSILIQTNLILNPPTAAAAAQGCIRPPLGLEHWWTLDETSGSTAHDIVGVPAVRDAGTAPGAINGGGPTSVTGMVAGAFLFDGSTMFASAADGSGILGYGNLGQSFTIDAWINATTGATGIRPIVDKRNVIGSTESGYHLFLSNGFLGMRLTGAGGGLNYVSTTPNLADNQWHFVAATVDRSSNTLTLYVDGVVVRTDSNVKQNDNNNAPFLIGSGYPISIAKPYFKGELDEIEIFNRALPQSDVQLIFHAGSAGKCHPCIQPPSGLDHWWALDEQSGSTAHDIVDARDATTGPGAINSGGPTSVTGMVGRAFLFNGVSMFASAADNPSILSYSGASFSIDAWIKATTTSGTGIRPIVDKRNSVGSEAGYQLFLSNGFLGIRLASAGSGLNYVSTTPNLSDGNWHFVAATVDRAGTGTLVLYVDGVVRLTVSSPHANGANTAALLIGSGYPIIIAKPYFNGTIDELEFFKSALPQSDVQSIFNAGNGGKCRVGLGQATTNIYAASAGLGFEETLNVFDNSGAGYLIAHRTALFPPTGNKVVFIYTDSTRVSVTGELLFSPDYSNAVTVAGRAANPTTAFYEDNWVAPLKVKIIAGNIVTFIDTTSGLTVGPTIPFSSLTPTDDYFVMETFTDGGHTVVAVYGINAPGTLASGVYFDNNFGNNNFNFVPPNYPATAYIVHWQGTNPNVPLPTDTYTIVYHT